MDTKGLEVVDLREVNILRHLTDKELSDIEFVHVYGSGRDSFEGPSALYRTKNDEVFLAGFESLIGNSYIGVVPEERKGVLKRSVKVQELSGKSVRKIVVGAEFGAALTADNDLYLWGCDLGHSLTKLALKCHHDGACCPKCSCETRWHNYDFTLSFSSCKNCGNFCNLISILPHPADWKGKIGFVVGYVDTGTKPKIPYLFCSYCKGHRQCVDYNNKLNIFTLIKCGSCGRLIGDGIGDSLKIPPQTNQAPHKVTFPTSIQIQDIAAGTNFLLIRTSSELIIWGEVGGGRYNSTVINPDEVDFAEVACGSSHVAVVSTEGDLYTCGVGDKGQLGYTWSVSDGYTTLKKVPLETPAIDVACGQNSTVCLLQNGAYTVYGKPSKIVSSGAWSLSLFDAALISVPSFVHYAKIMESSLKHLLQPNGKRSAVLTGDVTDTFILLHGLKSENTDDAVSELCTRVHDASIQTDLEPSMDWNKTNAEYDESMKHSESESLESPSPTTSDSAVVMSSIHQSVSNVAHLFGQLLFSDLTLKLADGDFPVHRSVLYGSSAYFSQSLADSESPGVLDMSSYNATAYRGLLKYLYGVPLGQITCEDLFDLYILASSYKEDWIATDVYSKLKNAIDDKTVLALHNRAKAANSTELLEECLAYINTPEFQKSLFGILSQDENMITEFSRFTKSYNKS